MRGDLVDELRRVVGTEHVLVDAELTERYRIDWTGRYRADSAVVVRPADVDEVAAVVRCCAAQGAAICPQGGNTGLVGGSVPLGGEVVVSTSRLGRLDRVDTLAATVVAGAGVTLGELQQHVGAAGFEYGVDLGARDSATVGGTIATNAGGTHVIRWGTTRANVVGIRAVLADGSVVGDLTGLVKDNTGYHLPGLLCGSEGTLGIITDATLSLHRRAAHTVTALIGFESIHAATAAVAPLVAAPSPIDAIEFMLGDGLRLVRDTFDLQAPLAVECPAVLLVEASSEDPMDDRLGSTISSIPGVVDAAVASSEARRASLWRHRELHTEAIAGLGPPVKLDVTVPLRSLSEFVASIGRVVSVPLPEATVWLFGHAGDGNVHVNVSGVAPADEERCADVVLAHVLASGGSVSAEHGIGRMKRPWLERQRGAHDVAAFRRIKQALDPTGVFQPDVLLP
ncbi:MAG: FAD-binding oxidoreductase [Actinomycetota bacterium]